MAYTTLCRPLLEYATEAWDPHLTKDIDALERVQSQAVRFIKNAIGRNFSVTEAREELGLELLELRRSNARGIMLVGLVASLDLHPELREAYEQVTNDDSVTRSKGKPGAFSCNSSAFYYSFLPRTTRDLRIGTD